MTIRKKAKEWLALNHSSEVLSGLRVSKYYSEKDIWFFTFPTSYFEPEKIGHLNILLQYKNEYEKFYYLKVPFSFFRDNKQKFDIRSTSEKFDLHISAKQRNWLCCERSSGVSFCNYIA